MSGVCLAAVTMLTYSASEASLGSKVRPMTTTTEQSPVTDVTLECKPTRIGTKLSFPYTVMNRSEADIYVMDAVASVDPSSKTAVANRDSVVIYVMSDGRAHVLKGIAPLPTDRRVTVRIIPFATKLPPGETLTRQLDVPLPLAETSPYFADLPLRQYEMVDIPGVLFSVDFLRSTAEGFSAMPVDFAPDLYRVSAKNTVGMTERLSTSFPTQRLSIMKRGDAFPRPD
jgi:hypothetical protein